MTPKFKFADGEKVLCFHGPLIYEAKLLKSQVTKDKQIKYFIHYAGWNKNWDEWVPENRVLKFTDQNCQRQKEVSKQHAAASKNNRKSTTKGKKGDGKDGDSRASTPSKESGSSTPTVPSSRGRGSKSASKNSADIPDEEVPKKKRGRADTSNTTNNTSNNTTPTSNNTTSLTTNSSTAKTRKNIIKIPLPVELKQILVDDWDAINRQRKLLEIPAKITVEDILENYVAFKKQSKTSNINNIRTDITAGLIEYFNVMLGSQLLYKFERPQYSETLQAHPNTPMCKLYGAYHFLRLFVNLGKMLAYTALDEKYIQTLQTSISDIFKYLIKNSSQYFDSKNFINSSPEYHRRTQ
uniref:Mortality factor 4-like protein 1 n=1 Tax=Megaselia scalaris TaxID=36166 RepID=T1GNH3_MEGSC